MCSFSDGNISATAFVRDQLLRKIQHLPRSPQMKLVLLFDGLFVAVPESIQAIMIPLPPQPESSSILDSIQIVLAQDIHTKLQCAQLAIQTQRKIEDQQSSECLLRAQLARNVSTVFPLQSPSNSFSGRSSNSQFRSFTPF